MEPFEKYYGVPRFLRESQAKGDNPGAELERTSESDTEIDPFIIQTFDPASDEIEALFQATFGAGARVVAVIGVGAGDGASSCAAALAQRSMMSRRTTLLVGTHGAEKPHYCRIADGPHEACRVNELEDTHLCQICIAPIKNSPSIDLAWKRFGAHSGSADAMMLREPEYLKARWAKNYSDWSAVVLDCEPTLAEGSVYPGRLVAQSADAVILVARSGVATTESIAKAKLALGSAKIIGIAVNGRDQRKVGEEIARRLRRILRRFPRIANFLADRVERMRLLDVDV